MKKKIVVISLCVASALSVGIFTPIILKSHVNNELRANSTDNQITFNKQNTLHELTVDDNKYEYAYTTSSLGNKYGAIVNKVVGPQGYTPESMHDDEDLFSYARTSNFIYFTYGEVNSDGSFVEASFDSGIKSVTMECKYETQYTLSSAYIRVYYLDENGNYNDTSSSCRKSYTITPEYTTVTCDLTSVDTIRTKNIKIGMSISNALIHIKSVTVDYNC